MVWGLTPDSPVTQCHPSSLYKGEAGGSEREMLAWKTKMGPSSRECKWFLEARKGRNGFFPRAPKEPSPAQPCTQPSETPFQTPEPQNHERTHLPLR